MDAEQFKDEFQRAKLRIQSKSQKSYKGEQARKELPSWNATDWNFKNWYAQTWNS